VTIVLDEMTALVQMTPLLQRLHEFVRAPDEHPFLDLPVEHALSYELPLIRGHLEVLQCVNRVWSGFA